MHLFLCTLWGCFFYSPKPAAFISLSVVCSLSIGIFSRCNWCDIETAQAFLLAMAAFVRTVTLKHWKPHYKPDSHAACLSHSERAITARRREAAGDREESLLPDTHWCNWRKTCVCVVSFVHLFWVRRPWEMHRWRFKSGTLEQTDKFCKSWFLHIILSDLFTLQQALTETHHIPSCEWVYP